MGLHLPRPELILTFSSPLSFSFYQLLGAVVLSPVPTHLGVGLFPSRGGLTGRGCQSSGPCPTATPPRERDGHPCPQAPLCFQECFAAGFFTLRAV